MKRPWNFRFSPYQSGTAIVLGPREAEVMDLVWEKGSATVTEIYQALKKRRNIAYTTIMTIMSRLVGKGLLQRALEGNAYRYSAAVTREELAKAVVQRVLDSLLKEFTEPAFSYLLGRLAEVDEGSLAQLEELINNKKRSSS